MKEVIKEKILDYCKSQKNSFDLQDFIYTLIEDVDWIQVEDEDGEIEPLDLENCEITEITDDFMIMECGGDWQMPHIVKFTVEDDELTVEDLGEVDLEERVDEIDDKAFCAAFGFDYDEDTYKITNINNMLERLRNIKMRTIMIVFMIFMIFMFMYRSDALK